jgi:hypothetical protein
MKLDNTLFCIIYMYLVIVFCYTVIMNYSIEKEENETLCIKEESATSKLHFIKQINSITELKMALADDKPIENFRFP